jgi:hypothetical protein
MFKKFTMADKLMFLSALLSLIFSEVLYFKGEKADGTFIGLWVPSILAFGIYLKLINNSKNGIVNALNLGILESENNWIARFDVDDDYSETRLI